MVVSGYAGRVLVCIKGWSWAVVCLAGEDGGDVWRMYTTRTVESGGRRLSIRSGFCGPTATVAQAHRGKGESVFSHRLVHSMFVEMRRIAVSRASVDAVVAEGIKSQKIHKSIQGSYVPGSEWQAVEWWRRGPDSRGTAVRLERLGDDCLALTLADLSSQEVFLVSRSPTEQS